MCKKRQPPTTNAKPWHIPQTPRQTSEIARLLNSRLLFTRADPSPKMYVSERLYPPLHNMLCTAQDAWKSTEICFDAYKLGCGSNHVHPTVKKRAWLYAHKIPLSFGALLVVWICLQAICAEIPLAVPIGTGPAIYKRAPCCIRLKCYLLLKVSPKSIVIF